MTLENGLTLTDLARSMMRVFVGCCRRDATADELAELVLDGPTGAGWVGAAGAVIGEYQASEQGETTFRAADLAARVRQAFFEAAELPAGPEVAAREALAWEAVARHAAGAVGCDESEASNLLGGEAVWPSWLTAIAANRGIDLGD